MSANVWIILVNYGFPEVTIDCVESIKKSSYKNVDIVIVDNNSPDNSVMVLNNILKDDCYIISSNKNLGFAGGNNLGIRFALKKNADYILLLNNDTVIEKNMVEHLVKSSDNNTVTVPKMYYFLEPDKIWYAGGQITKLTKRVKHIGMNQYDGCKFSTQKYVNFATGCCILIPANIIHKIGMLDESFFMYWEDLDYSMRLLNENFKILYVPEAKLWHKVSTSSGAKSLLNIYYDNRNRFIILKRYNFGVLAWSYTLLTRIIYLIYGLLKNSNEKIIWKSWIDFYSGIKGQVDLK